MSEPAAAPAIGSEPVKKAFTRKPVEKSTATPFEHEERAKKHLTRRKHEKKEKPKRKLAKGGLSRKEEKQLGQQLIQQLMDNQNLLTSSYTKNGTYNTISFSFLLCSLHWPIYVVFAGLFILSYVSSTLLLVLSFLLFSPHFLCRITRSHYWGRCHCIPS